MPRVPAGPWETGAGTVQDTTTPEPTEHVNRHIVDFYVAGAASVAAGVKRWYSDQKWRIVEVRASVNTAPTGAALVVDVNKNGTTIFTTQGARPSIAVSQFTDGSNVPAVTTLADGDYLTVDVDQVGSTVAGSDLVVQVVLEDVLD